MPPEDLNTAALRGTRIYAPRLGNEHPQPRTLPPPELIRSHVRQERKVVVCESMVCPRALREAVAHILFRFLQVTDGLAD